MIRLPLRPRGPWLAAALLAASFLASSAVAQFIQTGAGPYDYNTTANWSGGTINGTFSETPTATQIVTFAADTTLTTGLTFHLGGAALTSMNLIANGTDHTVTLAGDVSVSGTTSAITFGSTTPGNKLDLALGGVDRTFTVTAGSSFYVNNVVSGSNALTKAGAGQVTLAGVNTYTGATTVNNGVLYLNTSGALPAAANITVNATSASSFAQLVLGGNFTQTIASLTLGGAGQASSSTNAITLNAGSTLTLGGTLTYDGTGAPTSGSSISGPGTLALGANRTFNIGDSGGTNSELNISTPITGAGFSLTKTGLGRLALNASSGTNYSGGTIINAGNIFLNANNTLPASGAVTINDTTGDTSTLILGNNFTQTIGALTFGGAGSTASAINTLTLNTGSTLTLGGTVSVIGTGDHTSNWNINGAGTLALGGNRIFDIANSTGTSSELNILVPITGSGASLTKTGAGRLALNASTGTTYNGGTIVNGGQLFLNANNTLLSTGSVNVADTAGAGATLVLGGNFTQTIGTLTFGGAGSPANASNTVSVSTGSTLTLGGTVTYNATGNSNVSAAISGAGTVNLGANRTFNIGDSSTQTVELNLTAIVSGSGFSLTKMGAGGLRLAGANTYSGGTTVSAGGLLIGNASGSAVGTGALAIQSGAFLRGTGFIGGATTIESGGSMGTAGTGGTPGTLTFTNGLTLNDGAVFNFQLGTASDKFVINNSSILTGASTLGSLTINLTAGTGFGPGTYTLFDYTAGGTPVSFDASDFVLGTTVSGYTYGLALNGTTLQLQAATIPEPATCAAIFGGVSLLGAAIYRRRRVFQS